MGVPVTPSRINFTSPGRTKFRFSCEDRIGFLSNNSPSFLTGHTILKNLSIETKQKQAEAKAKLCVSVCQSNGM